MGKKTKEGQNLLGLPTFKPLDNGRFKCVETGHELLAHARDSYAQSKHCRLGLIDSALAKKKPPLNMFIQDPVSRSKLKCKLTGVTINKTEEHIWKHINGKCFLNMLEKMEVEKEIPNGTLEKKGEEKEEKEKKKSKDGDMKKKKKKKKKNKDDGLKNMKKKKQEENAIVIAEMEDSIGTDVDLEEEYELWMPPVGDRWDHDDGGEPGNDGTDEEAEGNEQKKKRMKADSDITRLSPSLRNLLDSLANLKGEQVAARVSQEEAEKDEWIIVEVIHFDKETRVFEVLDEEPGDDEESSEQKQYKLPMTHIIPFPKRGDLINAQDFHLGKHVLAVYPGTTALYKATVVQTRKKKTDDYVLEFDDDEEEGCLPRREVPYHRVVPLPQGYRQ